MSREEFSLTDNPPANQYSSDHTSIKPRAKLDELHHVAVQVQDVRRAVAWYQERFRCQISWLDDTWALLRFANTSLALVVPGEHPPHLAFTMEEAESLGELSPHRDGTRSIYIEDSEGNVVECMDPKSL